MKKNLLRSFILIVVILMMAVPAAAARFITTGSQIEVGPDGAVVHYPGDTPFHIRHGWYSLLIPGEKPDLAKLVKAEFELEVDGIYVNEDYIQRMAETGDEPGTTYFYKLFYFNFPEGMNGTHTFTGHWSIQCKYWQEVCKMPDLVIEVATSTITVVFDPQ
jgi:hypothetical protein